MIKRRHYKQDHADKDEASSSSSSSSSSESDSEPETHKEEQEEALPEQDEEEDAVNVEDKKHSFPSSGSGYESEDSSVNEIEHNSSDNEDAGKRDSTGADYTGRTLKFNSVYKCRLCPRIVCLTQESLTAHLHSKRHARSEKLLSEGRLKLMLNSDGEIEEEAETHAERHARTISVAKTGDTQSGQKKDASNNKKKNKGRQRQKERLKLKRKKMGNVPDKAKTEKPTKKTGDAPEKAITKEGTKKTGGIPEKAKTKESRKNKEDVPNKAKTKEQTQKPTKKRRKYDN